MDEHFMRRALALAVRGRGAVSPNPLVGAVVVSHGRIVGEGWHARFGGPHAEVVALRRAGARARGATLYVTLEPCVHHGKTPPCTDAILAARIARVVAGVGDPNPVVGGKGVRRLMRGGIRVACGKNAEWALEAQENLNRGYFHYHLTGYPYVVLKTAMSLDGKIATSTGESRWISSPAARTLGHRWRSDADVVLTGVGTVTADDPRLTARAAKSVRQPVRVIVDSRARTPPSAKIFRQESKTIVAVTSSAPGADVRRLAARGAEIWTLPARKGRVALKPLFKRLANNGYYHVLVEAGGTLNGSLMEEGLVDHLKIFVSLKLVGGASAPTWWEGRGIGRLASAFDLRQVTTRWVGNRRSGEDLLFEGDVHRHR